MSYATDAKPYFKVETQKIRNSWCYRVFSCCGGQEQLVSGNGGMAYGWIKSGARSRQGCINRGYDTAKELCPGLKDFQDTANA